MIMVVGQQMALGCIRQHQTVRCWSPTPPSPLSSPTATPGSSAAPPPSRCVTSRASGRWNEGLDELSDSADLRYGSRDAEQILDDFVQRLHLHATVELLLGFPSAPFIIPMATASKPRFLRYAEQHPSHRTHLSRTGQGNDAEWVVNPADDRTPYEVRFTLPDAMEAWIDEEERQRQRIWTIKTDFLANIMVYYRQNGGIHACHSGTNRASSGEPDRAGRCPVAPCQSRPRPMALLGTYRGTLASLDMRHGR